MRPALPHLERAPARHAACQQGRRRALRLEDFVGFIPWVGMEEFLYALAVVGILGPVLTLLPTLVLTRKYLKV
jgi:hypothetical protein